MAFNDEQRAVLDTYDKNIIVSASAGSGKTTVMIEKIMRLLEKVSIKNILVLTYTKSAATEMKQRLDNTISQNLEKEIYLRQLEDLEVADITTFHAFYQKTIKKYFYKLGISPNFAILDDSIALSLKNIALKQTLDDYSRQNKEKYFSFYQMFSRSRSNASIKNMILRFSEFYSSVADPSFKTNALGYFDTDFAIDYLKSYILGVIQYYQKSFISIMQKASDYSFDSYVEFINSILSQLDCLKDRELDFIIETLSVYKDGTLRKDKTDEIDFQAKINNTRKSFKSFIEKIKKFNLGTGKDIQDSKTVCKQCVEIIFELEKIFKEKYSQLKETKNGFDFNDLELFMNKLLEDEEVKNELKANYQYIFVDEFQDANSMQESILQKMQRKNNRFMVGDVKQSIYMFRQSNPEIFLEKVKNYSLEEDSTSKNLNYNYRSHKDILNFINMVFCVIMTDETSGIDYEKNKFIPAIEYENNDLPRVEIDILKTIKNDDETKKEVYSVKNHKNANDEIKNAQKEAIIVAEKILELKKRKIYDRNLKAMRDVEFGDIAILIKSREGFLPAFASKLASLNIPFLQNLNTNLFETEEGTGFIKLLKIINNPFNELDLGLFMLSSIGGFTESQMVKIKQNSNLNLWESINNYKLNDELSGKLQNLIQNLKVLRTNLTYIDTTSALLKFYNDVNLEERLLEYADGERRFLYYVTLAKYFNNGTTINEALESENLRLALPNLSRQPSCVEITTIHASKGLEYPIVFLCNAGGSLNSNHDSNEIVVNQKIGIATKYYNIADNQVHSSVFYETIKLENRKEERAEKLRLLYVALSRAQNHLYVVGSINAESIEMLEDYYTINAQNSYLSLILGSLKKSTIKALQCGQDKIDEEEYSIRIYDDFQQDINLEKQSAVNYVNNDVSKQIAQEMMFEYKNNFETKLALKNSVSGLNKDDYSSINYIPKQFEAKEHLSGYLDNEIGTIYHRALEKLEFNKIYNVLDVKKQLEQLFNEQVFSADELKVLNCEILWKNISILKGMIGEDATVKEQAFIMKIPYNEVTGFESKEKIMIQGVIDLLIVGKRNIVVDYKLTKMKDEETLKARYSKQLMLYKKAAEKGLNLKIDECYLLSLLTSQIIKIN